MLEVCRVVPGGVLMFVPSYALMDKLTRRWQVGRRCYARGARRSAAAWCALVPAGATRMIGGRKPPAA